MKKTKQQLIDEYKAKPFEVDDPVYVEWVEVKKSSRTTGKGKSKKTEFYETTIDQRANGTVVAINGDILEIQFNGNRPPSNLRISERPVGDHGAIIGIENSNVKHSTYHVGSDRFVPDLYTLSYYSQDIRTMLYYLDEKKDGGTNFDPYIIDIDGNKQYFQRGYVWTLEQKQALIDSIYKYIDIGKFVLAYYHISTKLDAHEAGDNMFNIMCIDGKQRMTAIKEFVEGKFPDSYGDYWDDLSSEAQWKFKGKSISVCMLSEREVTPAFIKQIFLGVNFTGTPMSPEHIEYVKSIRV